MFGSWGFCCTWVASTGITTPEREKSYIAVLPDADSLATNTDIRHFPKGCLAHTVVPRLTTEYTHRSSGGRIRAMVPVSGQWRCRICDFDRYHLVTVLKKNGTKYETSFYACSRCSIMFLNPAQWSAYSSAPANIEAPPSVVTSMRRRR